MDKSVTMMLSNYKVVCHYELIRNLNILINSY